MTADGDSAEASATALELAVATKGDDEIWRDEAGMPLRLSASDLERHAYCPLSWHLSKTGVSGEGEAIERGKRKHEEIHKAMDDYRGK